MALKIEKPGDLEKIAKYMTKAVKQDNKPPCFWDLKDLIHYFEEDNGFDSKVRVPIWESMNGYTMPKTYNNILAMLNSIIKANESEIKKT